MSVRAHPSRDTADACVECRRRSWLLAALSASLDYCARDRTRLENALALGDRELLQALGGRRRAELSTRYETLAGADLEPGVDEQTICRHHPLFPRALREEPGAPWMLHVAGGAERLAALTGAPVVAIAGAARASDYGVQMARGLARGLAASGVTVISGPGEGIARAALTGAVDADGAALALLGGGLDSSWPAGARALRPRLLRTGCAVSELPHGCSGRRWGSVAGERIMARLARVVVVVEAEDRPAELALARTAAAYGRTVAAMPGRLTSPLSTGCHSLLIEGARLVRGAHDALDLLYPLGASPAVRKISSGEPRLAGLEPRLARILEQVGAGRDTPERLTERAPQADEVLAALSELELMGLLSRGEGGRYLPRGADAGDPWAFG